MSDLRSDATIRRLMSEIRMWQETSERKRREAADAMRWANRFKDREEEIDAKADEADKKEEELVKERDDMLERIGDLHQDIDDCDRRIRECELEIDSRRARILNQRSVIHQRREQSKGCALEAQQAGRAAHDASLHGLNRRELGIRQSPSRYSLREAERLQQAFIKSLKESKDLEDLAQDGERNIWRLCQQMSELSRQRADL